MNKLIHRPKQNYYRKHLMCATRLTPNGPTNLSLVFTCSHGLDSLWIEFSCLMCTWVVSISHVYFSLCDNLYLGQWTRGLSGRTNSEIEAISSCFAAMHHCHGGRGCKYFYAVSQRHWLMWCSIDRTETSDMVCWMASLLFLFGCSIDDVFTRGHYGRLIQHRTPL